MHFFSGSALADTVGADEMRERRMMAREATIYTRERWRAGVGAAIMTNGWCMIGVTVVDR